MTPSPSAVWFQFQLLPQGKTHGSGGPERAVLLTKDTQQTSLWVHRRAPGLRSWWAAHRGPHPSSCSLLLLTWAPFAGGGLWPSTGDTGVYVAALCDLEKPPPLSELPFAQVGTVDCGFSPAS